MLPLCLFFLATDASATDSPLGARWRAYALVQLGADPSSLPRDSAGNALRRAISADLERHSHASGWSLSFAPQQRVRPLGENRANFRSLTGAATGVQTEGLQAPLALFATDHTGIELQAVLAQQAYASNTLRYRAVPSVLPERQAWSDMPTGKAVAVQLQSMLAPGLAIEAAAQSQVRMTPFRQVTGAYADPGQFDLPGRVQAEFHVEVSGRTSLRLGADHLFYSRIDPFLSRNLPAGVMGLLGDAGSPRFEWQDLTVYSVAIDRRLSADAARQLSVQMTTRQQPAPSSAALRDALALSDGFNWSLQYRDRLGLGELSLSAAYALDSYFLGPVLFRRSSVAGDQIEFEIGYRLSF
ncbi:MAG: hypothetical protein MUE46_11295 [Xanthomonadales bacterium]|jgi:hypothetical protein|nr:hypothetical protein [Xanthomonadales bacterium]